MKAYTRNGREIRIGQKYMFADINGNIEHVVIEILDKDAVRINDFWRSSRWACNALYEIKDESPDRRINGTPQMPGKNSEYWDELKSLFKKYE